MMKLILTLLFCTTCMLQRVQAQQEKAESSTSDYEANNIKVTSVTELDLIRRQLASCWNVPAVLQDAKDIYVEVRLEMNPDGTVQSAIVTKSSGDGSYKRALEDSALRAIRNPKCSPFKLPLHRYDQWKTMTIRFGSKDMF
ncbi:MAG: energy transducer TonB [Alphaproteobacteria bacterium]|nr:energy transducer TonB [Alphaproteobacteria bacterium]